jgi:hypothetical protein
MSDTGADFVGGCLCGAVRFRSTAPPLTTRYCWCRDCQYFAAGNATVNCVFPRECVTIDGETRAYESRAASGNLMRRHFCPTCGTPLFSLAESRPGWVIVRAGVLDDPNRAEPAGSIWVASAPRWACVDPDLEQVPGQPSPPPSTPPR